VENLLSKEKKAETQKIATPISAKAKPKPSTPVAASADQQRNMAALAAKNDAAGGGRNVQGILIKDVVIGQGAEAHRGRRVTVHYVGKLKNGKVFDSSKKPFQFGLGVGEVIAGWDIGVNGMKVGGKRNLIVPPQMAYGKAGAPPTIPSNATLVFDVQLLSVK
jgi:FK506-binding nuclear protein